MNTLANRSSFTVIAIVGLILLNAAVAFAQAKSPSRVLLYTSVPQQLATQFAGAFMKKRPDIKVEIYRAGSTEVGAKIAAEREVIEIGRVAGLGLHGGGGAGQAQHWAGYAACEQG